MAQGPQPSGLSWMTGGIKGALPAMLNFTNHLEGNFQVIVNDLGIRLHSSRCTKVPGNVLVIS